eukprot:254975_1
MDESSFTSNKTVALAIVIVLAIRSTIIDVEQSIVKDLLNYHSGKGDNATYIELCDIWNGLKTAMHRVEHVRTVRTGHDSKYGTCVHVLISICVLSMLYGLICIDTFTML